MRNSSWMAGLALLLMTGCAASGPQTQASAPSGAPSSPGLSSADLAAFDDTVEKMPDRRALKATVMEAVRRHDYRAALAMEQSWAKRHPDDLEVREDEPMLYLTAGDPAGWERARTDLMITWARIRNSATPPARPGFGIDVFKAGDKTVMVQQCYERAGRFGVLYRFDVTGQDQKLYSFFTVESPESDNDMARQAGMKSPVFFFDHNRPGSHETVETMDHLPAYPILRKQVLDYIANPKWASRSTQPGFVIYGCEFARVAARS